MRLLLAIGTLRTKKKSSRKIQTTGQKIFSGDEYSTKPIVQIPVKKRPQL